MYNSLPRLITLFVAFWMMFLFSHGTCRLDNAEEGVGVIAESVLYPQVKMG